MISTRSNNTEVFAVKFNRRLKLVAAMLFASVVLSGAFATAAPVQNVQFRISSERREVARRPVSVNQIEVQRRPIYWQRDERYRDDRYYRQRDDRYRYRRYGYGQYRHYHRHHGVRVWIR